MGILTVKFRGRARRAPGAARPAPHGRDLPGGRPHIRAGADRAGRNPKRRPLYDRGNHLGYWIRIRIDTVRSLDQRYQP